MPPVRQKQDSVHPDYSKKVWIAAGIFSLVVVVLLLFRELFGVLLLAFAGALIAIFFHGFAGLLRRFLPLSRGWSVFISVVLNLSLVVLFFVFTGSRIASQVTELSDTLPQTIHHARQQLEHLPLGQQIIEKLHHSGSTEKTSEIARRFFSSTFGVVSDLYIVLLIGLFFTAQPSLYRKGIIRLLPKNAQIKGGEILDRIGELLKKWIKGQLFGMAFIAVLTGIGLWIIGMPMILTLALIAGLLNFIPNFGPIIALVPALLLALNQGTTTALIIVGIYTGVQIIQSAVTQPLIQKKMMEMPPALVIIGQVMLGVVSGLWGVLLASPLIGVIMVLVQKLWTEKQNRKTAADDA